MNGRLIGATHPRTVLEKGSRDSGLFRIHAAGSRTWPNGLTVAFVALCQVMLAACAADPKILTGKAGPDGVYSCSDVKIERVIEQHLDANDRRYHWTNARDRLHPHLKYVATEIAKATQGKMFSSSHCRIVSDDFDYHVFFKPATNHYVVDIDMDQSRYVSDICVTRNNYPVEIVYSDEELRRWQRIHRDEYGNSPNYSVPTSTKECFPVGELIGQSG